MSDIKPPTGRRTSDERIARWEAACGEGWAPMSTTPQEMLDLIADLKDAEARVLELERKITAGTALLVAPAPPWTVFADRGEPLAILPAGRPGTVLNVKGWDAREVDELVRAANRNRRFMAHRLDLPAALRSRR